MVRYLAGTVLFLVLLSAAAISEARDGSHLNLPSEISRFFRPQETNDDGEDSVGTRWAVLIAGSKGYANYLHQPSQFACSDSQQHPKSTWAICNARTIANICNAGISEDQMKEAASQACASVPSNSWSSL